MTYRALLIGNSVFDADASLNPLNAPTKDVARLHRALVDPATGLFADENVRLVVERAADELLDELDGFFAEAHRDDLLLLYYSGHGLLDERNQLFLCGRDTRSDRLLRTAVSNVRINEFIEQSVARCTVIILDCCSSGMFKGGDAGVPLAGPGRYVVSSTRGAALANDAAVPTGTSLFTEHLVTGLLGAADDRDDDGYLDLREIFDYVRTQLTATSKQVPHSRFDGDAAVVLARRPGVPHPEKRAARLGDPTFVLSENEITLRDVDPGERLTPEVVEIFRLGEPEVDCVVETDASWLRAQVHDQRVVVELSPAAGHNRAKILVRDRNSGTTQVLRAYVFVRAPDPATARSAPVPPPAEPATVRSAPSRLPVEPATVRSIPVPLPARAPEDRPEPPPSRPRRWLVPVFTLVTVLLLTTGGVAWVLSRHGEGDRDAVDALSTSPTPTETTTSPIDPLLPFLSPSATPSSTSPAFPFPITTSSSPKTRPISTKVTVPDLGTTEDSAQSALTKVGLTAAFTRGSSSEPEGQVYSSSPSAGEKVPRESTVTVFLSLHDMVKVPDVMGRNQDVATAILHNLNLGASVACVGGGEPGVVIAQSIGAGFEVKTGSLVDITVSNGGDTSGC